VSRFAAGRDRRLKGLGTGEDLVAAFPRCRLGSTQQSMSFVEGEGMLLFESRVERPDRQPGGFPGWVLPMQGGTDG